MNLVTDRMIVIFSFSGVPEWFYIIAFAVVIIIIVVNEWWTR
ncbi:MAG: hypothetical protein ABWX61_01285 [Paenisporosarcina sp.]